jgi:copper(I)-binding protein
MNKTFLAALLLAAAGIAPAPTPAASSIVISNVWSRPATATAVLYATIRNGGTTADALVGADAPGATAVELHETTESAGGMSGMSGSMTTAPMTMSMKKVSSMAVPAAGALILKPGGYHLMLIGIKRSWKLGDTFQIRFHFRHAGTISTTGSVIAE